MCKCSQCEKPTDGELNVFGRFVCSMSCYSAETQEVRKEQWELPFSFKETEHAVALQ